MSPLQKSLPWQPDLKRVLWLVAPEPVFPLGTLLTPLLGPVACGSSRCCALPGCMLQEDKHPYTARPRHPGSAPYTAGTELLAESILSEWTQDKHTCEM